MGWVGIYRVGAGGESGTYYVLLRERESVSLQESKCLPARGDLSAQGVPLAEYARPYTSPVHAALALAACGAGDLNRWNRPTVGAKVRVALAVD